MSTSSRSSRVPPRASRSPIDEAEDTRPVVVIAGAAGFVGRALAKALGTSHRVIGISRTPRHAGPGEGVAAWRTADLFSRSETELALRGARYAIFLVHSMTPSARLTQGGFDELDMLAADNFARAAEANGCEQLVYLGGLVPDAAPHLSPHLASRLEVERVLDRGRVPLTTLRAGMIVGPGGSSFEVMRRLVERLPAMVLPRWTETPTQPIDLRDVVALIAHVLGNRSTYGRTYDVGGPDVMTYREMIERTAAVLGKRLPIARAPAVAPSLSTLWITLITGAPPELVAPLVQSLLSPTVARDLRLVHEAKIDATPFDASVRWALEHDAPAIDPFHRPAPSPRAVRDVRSVQRLPLPRGRDAAWVADAYLRFLPRALWPLLSVQTDGHDVVQIRLRGRGPVLLTLERAPRREEIDRVLFMVSGGVLARRSGRARLELRAYPDQRTALVALHDFVPRLPWWLYVPTQAALHQLLMKRFARELARHQPAPVTHVTETPVAQAIVTGVEAMPGPAE